jgi:hypothetical protein
LVPAVPTVTPVLGRKMSERPKTMSVPEAGKIYFDLSRNASYAAAGRGEIPTIRVGKLLRVPVRALEQMLELTDRKQKPI